MSPVAAIIAVPFIVALAMRFVRRVKLAGQIVVLGSFVQLLSVLGITLPLFLGQVDRIVLSPDFIITRLDAAFMVLTACVGLAAMTHGSIFYLRESTRELKTGKDSKENQGRELREKVLTQEESQNITKGIASLPEQKLARAAAMVKAREIVKERAREHSKDSRPTGAHIRLNYACSMFFVMAMFAVFTCKNLGFLWVCVESTTLISAPLVYFNRTKNALEATWKYLIICSVGMSFALLGTLFIFAAGQHGAVTGGTLETYRLIELAPNLDYKLLRFGFIFCLLGYGTKAGMFPLHTWLPDAHSEAPAPSSALLSGSLLNCALFAIWRVTEIVTAAPHARMAQEITIWAGTLTVLAASFFLIRQHGLKRLFAFSSIENVGIMLVAIGLNSAGLFFLQALNHSIAKVALFLLSGNIVQGTGKKYIAEQGGLMASAPGWAVLLAIGVFSVTGAPPFGTFLSELLILLKAIDMHCYTNAIILVIGLALAFIVVCMHIGRVFLGGANQHMKYFNPVLTCMVPAILLLASLLLGLSTGPALLDSLK